MLTERTIERLGTALTIFGIPLAIVASALALALGWRWASRRWSIPCPAFLAWSLESPFFQRFNGTRITLDRLGLRPGQKVLEIGPGPGRLLIPAAQRVQPDGAAIGIDIQQAMIDRLHAQARLAGVTNLEAIQGDAAQPHVPAASFDLVFLCAVLGEIPDRAAALAQCFRPRTRRSLVDHRDVRRPSLPVSLRCATAR